MNYIMKAIQNAQKSAENDLANAWGDEKTVMGTLRKGAEAAAKGAKMDQCNVRHTKSSNLEPSRIAPRKPVD